VPVERRNLSGVWSAKTRGSPKGDAKIVSGRNGKNGIASEADAPLPPRVAHVRNFFPWLPSLFGWLYPALADCWRVLLLE
jgi:hypothetical protein